MVKFSPSILVTGVALATSGLSATHAVAAFATSVVSYTPGSATTSNPTYTDASSSLGAPAPIVAAGSPWSNVLSPFSPAYEAAHLVVIGDGGQLTLRLSEPVTVGAGREIGVISNVGLIDSDYPKGSAAGGTFGGGVAEVRVSANGIDFVSLGDVTFDGPASYYTNAGPYDSAAPANPQVSDFNKPFNGSASFDGQSYAQVVQTLGGSIGGTWIDVSPSGLTSVQYVQFVVANDGDPGTKLAIDAVTSVPEPATLGGLLGAAALLVRRSRPRRSARSA
jgi:hypothetical protein